MVELDLDFQIRMGSKDSLQGGKAAVSLERQKGLLESQDISQATFDQTQLKSDELKSKYEAATHTLKAAELNLANLPPKQTARVTLAAMDVGVLSIARFETPDPFAGMFGQRRYGINSRDVYDQIMDLGSGDTARLRFGGDGEMELARGGDRPLTEVQIVSLFSGAVAVVTASGSVESVDSGAATVGKG